FRVIAEDETERARNGCRSGDLDVASDKRFRHPMDTIDARAGQYDRRLNLAAADPAVFSDGRKWSDVGLGNLRARTDERGADDRRVPDRGARGDLDLAGDLARIVDVAVHPDLEPLQDQPVDLEHVGHTAGVFPVAADHLGANV